MTDPPRGAIMTRISEPQFTPYKTEVDELRAVLETCGHNVRSAQSKIDEQNAELTVLREAMTSTKESVEDVVNKKKNMSEAVSSQLQRSADLQAQESENEKKTRDLNEAIHSLKLKLQAGPGWSEAQEEQKHEILEKMEKLSLSLESKNSLSSALRLEICNLQRLVEQGETDIHQLEAQIKDVYAQVDGKHEEALLEQSTKTDLEQRLRSLQTEMEHQTAQLVEARNGARDEQTLITETEDQLRESKAEMEHYLRDYEVLFQQTQRLTEQLESLMYSNETMENENEVIRQELHLRERQINALNVEGASHTKLKGALLTKIAAIEEQRSRWEQEREHLREQITQIAACDIRGAWRECETHKKQIEDLAREREILNRKLGGSEKTAQLIFDLTKVNQNAKKNLQNEVNGYTATVKLQREQIEALVQDRERHEQQANVASRRYYVALEQLKLQEVQSSELQRKIVDGSSRLKQQQNLYEAVRSDRNLYSKNLIQSQEEIAEMKRRFKIMNHQIEQLKEEITTKDHCLVKEHFNHHNVDKERESLKNELTKIQKQIISSDQIIYNQQAETQKLTQIIQEADEERQRQHKETDAILGETNILRTQLIRRDDELATIYEAIKINWSSLQRGEARYAESTTEVQFLKERIGKMQAESENTALQMTSISDLRQTIHCLESDLLKDRNKIKVLQEELERPLNVHRWRALESSDPQRFQMIKKIQNLQKEIVLETEKVLEKEVTIQEKERLYVELKSMLGHQPCGTLEQIAIYQASLREKNQQLGSMRVELDMYKEQVAEFRRDIDGLANELDHVRAHGLTRKDR